MEGFIGMVFLWRRVETQKAPAGDLPSRGCLIEECEPPGWAAFKPQSRKWGSGGGSDRGGSER